LLTLVVLMKFVNWAPATYDFQHFVNRNY